MDVDDDDIGLLIDELGIDGMPLREVFPVIYERLRGLAHAQRRRWNQQETLSTTALVHETYLKLARQDEARWRDRGHFLRVVARTMRHILIDYAERRSAAKRGGSAVVTSLDPAVEIFAADTGEAAAIWPGAAGESRIDDLLALDAALNALQRENPRQAQVVELRFFAGLEVSETAEVLGVSEITVMRDWRRGRAWLYLRLSAP